MQLSEAKLAQHTVAAAEEKEMSLHERHQVSPCDHGDVIGCLAAAEGESGAAETVRAASKAGGGAPSPAGTVL